MKKIFTLFISLTIFSSAYAQTYYFNSDANGDNPEWRDASGVGQGNLVAGVPNQGTMDFDFVIETGIYESSGNENVYDFTVNIGAEFHVVGDFAINGRFTTLSTGIVTQVKIAASSVLDLSSARTPILNSFIAYESSTSTLYLGWSPTEAEFGRINPSLSHKGIMKFNKANVVYTTGNLTFSENVTYLFGQPNITLQGTLFTINSIADLTEDHIIIDGNLLIKSGKRLYIRSTAGSNIITGNVTIEQGGVLETETTGSIDINGLLTLNDITASNQNGNIAVVVGKGITCDNVTVNAYLNNITSGNASTQKGDFWREMGIPFNVAMNSVTWGSQFNAKIQDNEAQTYSYIDMYDVVGGTWVRSLNSTTLRNSGKVVPFEVYMRGGESINVTGGDLNLYATDYSHVMRKGGANVGGWNLIANPFLSYLDLKQTRFDNESKLEGGNNSYFSILHYTDGEVSGVYKKVGYGGTLADIAISPFQAFWAVPANDNDILTINRSNQKEFQSGNTIELQKKNLMDDDASPAVVIYLQGISEGYDESVVFSFPDNSAGNGDDLRLEDSKSLNWVPSAYGAIYINRGGNHLAAKETSMSDLSSNSFKEDLLFSFDNNSAHSFKLILGDEDTRKLDPSYNVYVTDKFTNTTVNLKDAPYEFTNSTDADLNRFEVQITTETLGESERVEASSIKLANKGNSIEFMMPSTSSIESVQFVSLNGQVVKTAQATNGQTEFDVAELNSGIYIAQLKLASGNVASYKFVK